MKRKNRAAGDKKMGVSRLFNDRKISTKIALGFACVLTVTAIISIGATMAFRKADAGIEAVVDATTTLLKMTELERHFVVLRKSLREYEQNGQSGAREEAKQAIATVSRLSRELAGKIQNPERKKQAEALVTQFTNYGRPFGKIVELREAETALQLKVLAPLGEKLVTDFHDLREVAWTNGDSDVVTAANEGNGMLMQVRINSVKFNTRHDKASEEAVEKHFNELNKFVASLESLVSGDARTIYDDIKTVLGKYHDGYLESGRLAEELKSVQSGMASLATAIAANIDPLKQSILDNATSVEKTTRDSVAHTGQLILILAIGGLAFGAVLALLIGRIISRPIVGLVPELERLAQGNFNVKVPGVGRKDEVGQIAGAVAQMAEKVSSTIAEIKASGREVTNASAEISTSTTDLSQRTEEQAASLEETSAAMEELSATVRKNAENAQIANQSASATRDVAGRGGEVVAQAVQAMAKIEDSSRKISDIIGVIDEIARQTNLLALNAAVEAARAGEAGRGFAVVASEVRSLAQRSSQAAKDIKDLIVNSNGQVKDGVNLVNKAGESLNEIVQSIEKVADIVADIANASSEQATGIDEINRALTQMDETTQQNSALVEENAATAKTLEYQAKAMDERVSYFQIGDEPPAEHDAMPEDAESVAHDESSEPAAPSKRRSVAA